jgi:hypothetical protein
MKKVTCQRTAGSFHGTHWFFKVFLNNQNQWFFDSEFFSKKWIRWFSDSGTFKELESGVL